MQTFAEVLAARRGDTHEALRFEGRSWSWDTVVWEAALRAALLRSVVASGEGRSQRHVGVLLQNVPDFVFWLLGATLNGDVVAGLNPTRRGAELRHDITHVDCDLVVTERHYLDLLDPADLAVGDDRVLDIDSADYADLLDAHAGAEMPDATPDPSAMLLLLFSSGSTGAPKAVICTQGRLGRLTDSMVERVSLHRNSVTYLMLPLFHGHAIMMNLATAAQVGATVVMVRKFSARRFSRDVREHRVTYFNYVGRVLSYILAAPRDPDEADNSLEVAFGSEASPAEVDTFAERFGCEVREGYGASEGAISIVPVQGAPRDSLGLPPSGTTAQIRDENNAECPRARFDSAGGLLNGEEATGEIVAVGRGRTFEGYYDNPEATAQRLKFDGADFWTGDLGYRDEQGYFYFAGRSAEWLRVDGENFAAAPVERILCRYPGFSGVYAYATPDPNTGDQLMCAVTLAEDTAFDPADFAAFLDYQPDLGTKWRPTFLRVVASVPTTANGKVDKAPLRAEAWEADDVWWEPSRGGTYVRMTTEDRARMRERFLSLGRDNALPAASRELSAHAGQ